MAKKRPTMEALADAFVEAVGVDSEASNQASAEQRRCELFRRDDCGLLEGIPYVYRDNHTINWRAMVKPEYTVINGQFKNELEQLHQKHFEDIKVGDVEDKYLLVLLAGFKELASVRGYESVRYTVATATPEYVGVSCQIVWTPNYETGNQPLVFEALADASYANTSSFGRNYLMAVAENRAFVRCVRNSLGIHIVGVDEIGPKNVNSNQPKVFAATEPHAVLQSILEERHKPFPKFKEEWILLGHEEAKDWNSLADIPVEKIYSILDAIKKNKK